MRDKSYYSFRTGQHPSGGQLDLNMLRRLVVVLYEDFREREYFQQAFGFECVDTGYSPGTAGSDVGGFFLLRLKKDGMWPVSQRSSHYSEADAFDVLELLFDIVSKPINGSYHAHADCGWHYDAFDGHAGRHEFRVGVTQIIRDYERGYEMTEVGEIVAVPPSELASLVYAAVPVGTPFEVRDRLAQAVQKFRRRGATKDDRRDAIRDLADVLEYLRPRAKEVLLHEDEKDLFNIANNFGIRHHNQSQKTQYDPAVWLSWMFYYYLATIHATVHLLMRKEAE